MVVIAEREGTSMASMWNEYLCLVPGEDEPYRLFTGKYEALAECDDFYDEGLDDYVLPDTIDGKAVVGIEDDLVVGGDLVWEDGSDIIEFSNVFDPILKSWLDETRWTKLGVLASIEKAIAQGL